MCLQRGEHGTRGRTWGTGGGAGARLMGEGTVPRQRFNSLSNWEKPRAPQVSNSPSFHPPTKDSVHCAPALPEEPQPSPSSRTRGCPSLALVPRAVSSSRPGAVGARQIPLTSPHSACGDRGGGGGAWP